MNKEQIAKLSALKAELLTVKWNQQISHAKQNEFIRAYLIGLYQLISSDYSLGRNEVGQLFLLGADTEQSAIRRIKQLKLDAWLEDGEIFAVLNSLGMNVNITADYQFAGHDRNRQMAAMAQASPFEVCPNAPVAEIQNHSNVHWTPLGQQVPGDGNCGVYTIAAIMKQNYEYIAGVHANSKTFSEGRVEQKNRQLIEVKPKPKNEKADSSKKASSPKKPIQPLVAKKKKKLISHAVNKQDAQGFSLFDMQLATQRSLESFKKYQSKPSQKREGMALPPQDREIFLEEQRVILESFESERARSEKASKAAEYKEVSPQENSCQNPDAMVSLQDSDILLQQAILDSYKTEKSRMEGQKAEEALAVCYAVLLMIYHVNNTNAPVSGVKKPDNPVSYNAPAVMAM